MVFGELFREKIGIEIGGPSKIFTNEGAIPIYPVIAELDGCNFSENSLWEQGLKEGRTYKWNGDKLGYQYICEGISISERMSPEKYDFVISSNCIEHIANPLKAIEDWLRLIKVGGIFLLVAPKKESNFDHNREVTPFNHLKEDYQNDIKEDDLTHMEEILMKHDLSMDLPAGNIEQFRARSLENFKNRALHHHIFSVETLFATFVFSRLETIFMGQTSSDYIVVGRKIQ